MLAGNLVDRLALGHVTVDVVPWLIFNVADASIAIGLIGFAISQLCLRANFDHANASVPAFARAEKCCCFAARFGKGATTVGTYQQDHVGTVCLRRLSDMEVLNSFAIGSLQIEIAVELHRRVSSHTKPYRLAAYVPSV